VNSFKLYIAERYVNLIGQDESKQKYAKEVYELIQKSYAPIGGNKGAGFESPERMIEKIPFWKLVRKGNKIVAGALYKDKGGRKRVAVFSDGTDQGKIEVGKIYKEEFSRAYFEVSDSALGFMVKLLGVDFIKKYSKSHDEVKKLIGDDIVTDVPADDPHLTRLPQLKKYFYRRKLGSAVKTKILLGTTGKTIQKDTV